MADEQVQHSDLIDDAIREAEQQLEAKLEALRMSALGDSHEVAQSDPSAAALRPTGNASAWSQSASEPADAWAPTEGWQEAPAAAAPAPEPVHAAYKEASSEDFGRRDPAATPAWNPDSLPRSTWDDHGVDIGSVGGPTPSRSTGESTTGSWNDAVMRPSSPDRSSRPARTSQPSVSNRIEDIVEEFGQDPEQPGGGLASAGPTESELQFWAQTRTALRHLQQSSESMPQQVAGSMATQFEQVVRDELAAPTAAIRQLQQQLPGYAEQVSRLVADELEAPTAAIRQMQEDMPVHLDRLERNVNHVVHEDLPAQLDRLDRHVHETLQRLDANLQGVLRDELPQQLDRLERHMGTALNEQLPRRLDELERTMDSALGEQLPQQLDRLERGMGSALNDQLPQRLDRFERSVEGHLQQEVDRFEQTVAANVTRLAQGLEGRVTESEGQLRSQFDRIETTMRGALERVERGVREELAGPAQDMRRITEQIPAQFARMERTLQEQGRENAARVSNEVRGELGSVGVELAKLNRAALDRLAAVSHELERERQQQAQHLDRDRLQRAEDVDLIVDTMATGWQGLFGSMSQLFDRVGEIDAHMHTMEQRVSQAMNDMEQHLAALQPAPVVVTVNHPDAQVAQSTRAGYITGQESTPRTSY